MPKVKTTTKKSIPESVNEERARQESQGFSLAHDDAHTSLEWLDIIAAKSDRIRFERQDCGEAFERSADYRTLMVQVAAVAVAAIESLDRKREAAKYA